jgi:hypothetical protein
LYRYLHIGERDKGLRIFDHFYQLMLGRVLSVDAGDVRQARALLEQYPSLSPRDLIHLAVMLHHGITDIVTADTGFDSVTGIHRIAPVSLP